MVIIDFVTGDVKITSVALVIADVVVVDVGIIIGMNVIGIPGDVTDGIVTLGCTNEIGSSGNVNGGKVNMVLN